MMYWNASESITQKSTLRFLSKALALALLLALLGCERRQVGQVEMFSIDKARPYLNDPVSVRPMASPQPVNSASVAPGMAAANANTELSGVRRKFGDPIRSNDDVITIQVQSVFFNQIPATLTGSHDVVLFSEVWENAASAYNSEPLTNIVYFAENQLIPGRFNFQGNLAYGPTKFKGHPLRIRFTLLILQKRKAEEQSRIIDTISNFVSTAAPQYSSATSHAARAIKGILKAQPDITSFDFETTQLSDEPEALIPVVSPGVGPEALVQRRIQESQGEDIEWLRYGKFALVETRTRKEKSAPLQLWEPGDHTLTRGWLTTKDGKPLERNYIIFTITPGQLAQNDDVLAAASKANDELLKSLRRSDADIQSAFDDINKMSGEIKTEVLRSKAEDIARRAALRADKTGKTNAEKWKMVEAEFKSKWANFTANLSVTDKEIAKKIETEVLEKYKEKYPVPTP